MGPPPPTQPFFGVIQTCRDFSPSSSINQALQFVMAQRHPSPYFPTYAFFAKLYRRFIAPLPLPSGYTCTSFLPTGNNGQPHGEGSDQEDATEGQTHDSRHEFIFQSNTSLISSPPKPSQHVFILDSGASRHVTGDKSLFSSPLRPISPVGSVAATYRARDGRKLPVAGVGLISSDSDFQLPDVMYVPDLYTGVILVSVPHLAERGYSSMFGGGQCHVKDQSSGEMVGKGRLDNQDGLYHLEFLKIRLNTMDNRPP